MSRIRNSVNVISAIFMAAVMAAPAHAFLAAENLSNGLDNFPNRPGDPFIHTGGSVLVAEAGQNVVIGSLGTCFGFGCRDDFDSFRLQVPDGLRIVRTELLVTNGDGTAEQLWLFPGPVSGVGVVRDPPNTHPDWQAGALFALTDSVSINGADPAVREQILGPGFYDVVAWNFNFSGGGAFEATFTAVEVVPLPAAFWFLLSGVVIGWRRRSEY